MKNSILKMLLASLFVLNAFTLNAKVAETFPVSCNDLSKVQSSQLPTWYGYVFLNGEGLLYDALVYLKSSSGKIIASTRTDGNGYFYFDSSISDGASIEFPGYKILGCLASNTYPQVIYYVLQ